MSEVATQAPTLTSTPVRKPADLDPGIRELIKRAWMESELSSRNSGLICRR